MIDIRTEDFTLDEVIKNLRSPKTGAIVSFLGTVRNDKNMKGLKIECYRDMAMKEMEGLRQNAISKFHVNDVAIIHRIGTLRVGEDIVYIAVSSARRDEAFKACRYLIDELKKIVPIWKKELQEPN